MEPEGSFHVRKSLSQDTILGHILTPSLIKIIVPTPSSHRQSAAVAVL